MSILVILAVIASPSLFIGLGILARAWDSWFNRDVREEASARIRERSRRNLCEEWPQQMHAEHHREVERHEALHQQRAGSPMIRRIEAELQEEYFPEKVLAKKALARANRFTS